MLLTTVSLIIGVALVLITLPLLLELLVLTTAAITPGGPEREEAATPELPSLTVLVPAHNEQALIGRCVRSLMSAATSGTEVLVIAHNCSDATASEAALAGARVLALDRPDQRGKGCALSYGFAAILAGASDAVLVIDADSVVDEGLIRAVRQRMQAGARALQCRYEVRNSAENQRTRLMTLAFYAANVIRPSGRARLRLSAGIVGNGFALHRSVLRQIAYNAHSIVEDLEFHLTLVGAGIRVDFVREAAVRGEMPVTARAAQAQRARWEGGRMRLAGKWAPRLIGDILRGHLREIEPLLDVLSLPIASGILLLLVAVCLPIPPLRVYGLAGLAVLVFHVTVAALRGPGMLETVRALSTVPAYLLWKVWMLPSIFRTSRSGAAWVRTERDSIAGSPQ
jgi:hypothetical protein